MPMAERQSLLDAELVMALAVPTAPVVIAVMPLASLAPAPVAMAAVFVVFVSMRVMVSMELVLS